MTTSYRNQSIDLLRKWMDWFLYDNGLRHERVKPVALVIPISFFTFTQMSLLKTTFPGPVMNLVRK